MVADYPAAIGRMEVWLHMIRKELSLVPAAWIDRAGAAVSIACAIQCIVFPLLVGVLSLIGLGFLAGDGLEQIFIVASFILALSSFCWGFRYHKHFHVFLFLAGGFFLIFVGRSLVQGAYEIPVVVSGTIVLAAGHFCNRRLCRACVVCIELDRAQSRQKVSRQRAN